MVIKTMKKERQGTSSATKGLSDDAESANSREKTMRRDASDDGEAAIDEISIAERWCLRYSESLADSE